MKRIEELSEGLRILAQYDTLGYSVQPEHDIIYAGPEEENIVTEDEDEGGVRGSVVSTDDAAALVKLGWHISSETSTWAFFT